jgi:hypothetical protein
MLKKTYRQQGIALVGFSSFASASYVEIGTHFTCFTGTTVQILTQKALLCMHGQQGKVLRLH